MRRMMVALLGAALLLGGCQAKNETASKPGDRKPGDPFDPKTLVKQPFHGDMKTVPSPDPAPEMIAGLKKGKLSLDGKRTIGEVFDGYPHCSRKDWKGTLGGDGAYYIDYVCTLEPSLFSEASLKEDVVKRWVTVKFATREGGETYVSLVTRTDLRRDGTTATTPYYPEDRERIVRAIYDRRELPL